MNIKATNIELTDAIKAHVMKCVESLGKLIDTQHSTTVIHVEVGKISEHHNSGDIYFGEFTISSEGNSYYAKSTAADLFSAIDKTRDDIVRQGRKQKGRARNLFERGSRIIKSMLRGK